MRLPIAVFAFVLVLVAGMMRRGWTTSMER
jgi:hypothetical protein